MSRMCDIVRGGAPLMEPPRRSIYLSQRSPPPQVWLSVSAPHSALLSHSMDDSLWERHGSGPQHVPLSLGPEGPPALLPQLPEGNVLVEPQAVITLLLGHVAPLLPGSTGGDRRGCSECRCVPSYLPLPCSDLQGSGAPKGSLPDVGAVHFAFTQSLPEF